MHFKWSFSECWNKLIPECFFTETPELFKQCLASLLCDNGGSPDFSYTNIATIGLSQIENFKKKRPIIEDWSTNSWLSSLTNDGVKIEFAFDEDYYDLMSIASVEGILIKWLSFIQAKPDLNKNVSFFVY